ncbi:hypothetical protein BD626DRAFT_584829 [Schizophyllum amplum]|uniref:MYND-type domain-containing protein n=1 Tax=Schizophyllum amplum TaxID=97359 RepID=A0A550C802_9AGAR|nr:hypothetical protein BD626DRAFT_584829 [Auriculariopsis ampla]
MSAALTPLAPPRSGLIFPIALLCFAVGIQVVEEVKVEYPLWDAPATTVLPIVYRNLATVALSASLLIPLQIVFCWTSFAIAQRIAALWFRCIGSAVTVRTDDKSAVSGDNAVTVETNVRNALVLVRGHIRLRYVVLWLATLLVSAAYLLCKDFISCLHDELVSCLHEELFSCVHEEFLSCLHDDGTITFPDSLLANLRNMAVGSSFIWLVMTPLFVIQFNQVRESSGTGTSADLASPGLLLSAEPNGEIAEKTTYIRGAMTTSPSGLAQELATMQALSHLADKIVGLRPLSPGEDQESAFLSLQDILGDRSRLAFYALKTEPPSDSLAHHGELVQVIVVSMGIFSSITNVSRHESRYYSLQTPLRALWPHIIKWAALLHPIDNHVMQYFIRSGRNVSSGILQAYFMIVSDKTHSKSFLHANPAVVKQALDLWIHFPKCIKPASLDGSVSTNSTIQIVRLLHSAFVHRAGQPTAEDRALFVEELIRVAGSKRALYHAFAQQTHFLTSLDFQREVHPTLATIWDDHYNLLINMVEMPELARSKIPATTIHSVVSAASKCTTVSSPALRFLNSLLRMAKSNAPLAHAVDAGIFDVFSEMREGRKPGDDDHVRLFARLLCAGMYHARVARAFVRRHPDIIHAPEPGSAPLTPRMALWRDITRVLNDARALYSTAYRRKRWQTVMQCHNPMGPHSRRVQICPCANAFYCSRSCQRMHRSAHLDSCCSDKGPWGLHGILSLADTLFICIAVRSYIDRNAATVERELSSLRIKQAPKCPQLVKQAVVRVDITDVLPDARHEVDVRTTYMPDAPLNASASVVVEVVLRAGKTSATRVLPFTIRLEELKTAGTVSRLSKPSRSSKPSRPRITTECGSAGGLA